MALVRKSLAVSLCAIVVALSACRAHERAPEPVAGTRKYLLERVDDVAVVQVYADGFERLTTKDKLLCWHLYQAAVAGRPIYLQQKCAEGLELRDTFEELITHAQGVDGPTLAAVRRYLTLFWVNSSPYDSITSRKNVLHSTPTELLAALEVAQRNGARLPLRDGETPRDLVRRLSPILFDPEHKSMVTAKNPDGGRDIVQASAATFYGEGVRLRDFDGFEERYELNSTVVRGADGQLVEQPWRMGRPDEGLPPGPFATEIAQIVVHLRAALPYAPELTRAALEAQIRFYETGERSDRVAYDVAWVADKDSVVDTVNSFVEVYVDPRGKKGSWEGIVSYEDPQKAALIKSLATDAQWFEDHMPFAAEFRKPSVKGISARSIDVIVETGDSGPVTPVGINLANDPWVREHHGSKSVSLANIVEAYAQSTPTSARQEFCWDAAEIARAERWVALTGDLLTNLHEVIGHASGRQASDRQGEPAEWIREYYSALEEGRADLIALYFMMDPRLKELGLLDDPDDAALAAYENYARNGGLQQLRRIKSGDQIEEDHMRNRQMVVGWIRANSRALEERVRDGKHYLVVTSASAFREAVGRLLALVQELKSTGDYARTKALFDAHGVRFDPRLRDEVVERYSHLDTAAYTGFVFPRLTPVTNAAGELVDVEISYPLSLERQMLEWSGRAKP